MTAQTLPNLGLQNGYADGENGWGQGYNSNLLALDLLSFLAVASTDLSAPPTTPVDGDRYVVAATPAATGAWVGKEKNVACYYGAAWHFFVPRRGWVAFSIADGVDHRFDGTIWAVQAKPYDIPIFVQTLPAYVAGVEIVTILFPRPVKLAAGMPGSLAQAKTTDTVLRLLPLYKNGASIGYVSFAAGAAAGTFTLATDTLFVAGDTLGLCPPNGTGITLAGISVTISATR